MIVVYCRPCNRVVSPPECDRELAEFARADHESEHEEVMLDERDHELRAA